MYLRKKERRSCTKVYSAGARGLPRAKSPDPCPTDPTTPKARFLFAIGILKDGPCCWLRASRISPLSCKTSRGLGCGWHLGDLGILESDDLPLVLLLYNDQRWAGFYFDRLVAFLKLHVNSGDIHRDIGSQKSDATYHETCMTSTVDLQ